MLRTVLPYVVFASLWILLSDRLLAVFVADPTERMHWSTYKGLTFVIITAAMLSSLLRRELMALKRTQVALFESEERLQRANRQLANIIEFLPDAMFVIDHDKRVVAWNRACEVMTGVKKEAILGRGDYAYAETIVGERRPILVDLLDISIPEIEARYKYIKRCGDTILEESFTPRLRGGSGAHIWGVAAPLFDSEGRRCGAIEVVRDITDQKRTEQALLESERNYRELVEHANSIILRWNSEGEITFLNDFGLRFFGYSATEILGRKVMDTIVPATESSGRDLRYLMNLISANPLAFEQNINENVRRNGKRVWIAWTNRIFWDAEGNVAGVLSVGTDITELKRAEDTIRDLNTSLEQRVRERTAQLEAANRDLESFTYSVSHDLRAPLRAISGFTNILQANYGGQMDEEGRQMCSIICKGARSMGQLIDDLLAFSRVGRAALHPSPLNMESLMSSLFVELTTPEDRQRIDFRVSTLPPAWGDPILMRQVWVNLLGNAIKYSSKKERAVIEVGSMTMGECKTRSSEAAGEESAPPAPEAVPQAAPPIDPTQIVYFIRDNGVGFDMGHAKKLFCVFQRLHSEREFEGTGVGLAIVQRIVQLHGGRVWAEAEPDKGATFYLTLQKPG